eukprot:gene3374-6674_t
MEATRKVSGNEAAVHEAVDYSSLKKTIEDGPSCEIDRYSTISTEVEERSKQLPGYMAEVIGIATGMYPGLLDLRKSGAIEAAVHEAVDYNILKKTIEDAVEWGGNYEIPAEYFSEDSALFEKHNGKTDRLELDRLSVVRVQRSVSGRNPDYGLIHSLAAHGMPVFRDPLLRQVHDCVNIWGRLAYV